MITETKNLYHKYMQETARVVNPEIESYFLEYKKDKDFFRIFEPLLKKRLKFPQLRTVISRLSFEIVGGKNWKRIAPILAAMEIHNMYLYLHNWIFDNKNSIWSGDLKETRKKINGVTIAAAITREIYSDAIDKLDISPTQKLEIERNFRKSIKETYHGQFLDINLTIDRFNEFKTEKDFLKLYELKSKILSGSFYSLSGYIGAILGGASKKQKEAIKEICQLFGTGLHISNDLGDFAPPKKTKSTFGKAYQDQLADIRENRLTFPVFSVLKNGSQKEKDALLKMVDNSNPTEKELSEAIKAIHSTGTFSYCKKYIRGYYENAEKLLHENFEKTKERDLFSVMLSVIRSNKFLTELRKFKN